MGGLLPASLQASAVIIMWVESREWMKLGGKALPCLAASGVVLVPFWMRTFCSTVQIDWSSCASQRSRQAHQAENQPQTCLVCAKIGRSCQADGLTLRGVSILRPRIEGQG